MIIGDFNIVRAIVAPFEANPVLLIYPDAVLPLAVSAKLLQTQPGNSKISQRTGGPKKSQLHPRGLLDGLKLSARDIIEKFFRLLVPAGSNHLR